MSFLGFSIDSLCLLPYRTAVFLFRNCEETHLEIITLYVHCMVSTKRISRWTKCIIGRKSI